MGRQAWNPEPHRLARGAHPRVDDERKRNRRLRRRLRGSTEHIAHRAGRKRASDVYCRSRRRTGGLHAERGGVRDMRRGNGAPDCRVRVRRAWVRQLRVDAGARRHDAHGDGCEQLARQAALRDARRRDGRDVRVRRQRTARYAARRRSWARGRLQVDARHADPRGTRHRRSHQLALRRGARQAAERRRYNRPPRTQRGDIRPRRERAGRRCHERGRAGHDARIPCWRCRVVRDALRRKRGRLRLRHGRQPDVDCLPRRDAFLFLRRRRADALGVQLGRRGLERVRRRDGMAHGVAGRGRNRGVVFASQRRRCCLVNFRCRNDVVRI